MVLDKEFGELVNPFLVERSTSCVRAPGDMFCIFVVTTTARAVVGDCNSETGEIPIATIEVRDVSGDPIKEHGGKEG